MLGLNLHNDAYFQSLISILRCIVELGYINICFESSMLSSHLDFPWEGHLKQVYQIFSFLKRPYITELVFNPSGFLINKANFKEQD